MPDQFQQKNILILGSSIPIYISFLFSLLFFVSAPASQALAQADAGPDQTVREGDTVILDGSNSLYSFFISYYSWQQTGGNPSVTLTGANTAKASFIAPIVGPEGTSLTFQLTVGYGYSFSDTDTTIVNVLFVNDPPVADAGPDQTVEEETSVTLNGSNSSDPDDGIKSYRWKQIAGPSVNLSNPQAVQPTFTTPNVAGSTSLTFELTVTDTGGLKAADTTTVNVTGDNDPPVADAGPNQTVDEGSPVTLNGSNSFDPDFGDTITHQWIQTGGTPTVKLNGANTATPNFTAPNVGVGGTSLTFELTVTDLGGLEDSDTIVINVSFVNQPPIADAGPNQTKEEETAVTLNGSNSSDPDEGDGIKAYRWSQEEGPEVELSDGRAVKPTFMAPNVGGSKSLIFKLTVTDFGGLKDSDSTIVNVAGDNDPPAADAGPDQAKEEEAAVTLNGSNSSDPDDGIKSFRWSQKEGPPVTLSSPQVQKPTFMAPNVVGSKSITFELTVTDFGGLKDSDSTIVNVAGDNDPPAADAGPDQTIDEEEGIVELYGAGSRDPDDGIKSYRWTQTAGPPVTLSNPLDAQPTFAPPNVLESGASLTFELTVTDMGGLESVDATIVNVAGDNDPPTANAGADQTVLEKTTVTLDGSNSSDPDDGIASYRWKQVAGQSATFSDPTSDQPTFEAPSFNGSGDKPLIFELIVIDNGGLQSSDSTTVSVSNFEKDNPGTSGGGCFIETVAYGFSRVK
jgi:hypothetical protein